MTSWTRKYGKFKLIGCVCCFMCVGNINPLKGKLMILRYCGYGWVLMSKQFTPFPPTIETHTFKYWLKVLARVFNDVENPSMSSCCSS